MIDDLKKHECSEEAALRWEKEWKDKHFQYANLKAQVDGIRSHGGEDTSEYRDAWGRMEQVRGEMREIEGKLARGKLAHMLS